MEKKATTYKHTMLSHFSLGQKVSKDQVKEIKGRAGRKKREKLHKQTISCPHYIQCYIDQENAFSVLDYTL